MTTSTNSASTRRGVKSLVKGILATCLPASAVEKVLLPWRKLYWYRRLRLDPKKNARIAARIVASGKPIKLELGSWKRPGMEDWIASDLGGGGDIQLDFTQPFPFPDNSIEKIYSSHVLEHFSYPNQMLPLLQECLRILKPGGIFSIAVPNARLFLDAYFDDANFDRATFLGYDVGLKYRSKIDYLNFIAYMGGEHKHLFDGDGLVEVLRESGFRDARLRDFDPLIDLEVRRHESIYAIAAKQA
jgi:predicted SAM-dependent methyltransferase